MQISLRRRSRLLLPVRRGRLMQISLTGTDFTNSRNIICSLGCASFDSNQKSVPTFCILPPTRKRRISMALTMVRTGLRLRHLKKTCKSQNQIVLVLGCMAECLQSEILKEQMANLGVGPDAYRDLPLLLDQHEDVKKYCNNPCTYHQIGLVQ
jgi:tRNA A37 methylthiotransferase MiaB